jgi:class III poly(R)-hydroxyalkanoic acid synthase PhaE subunit
MSEKTIHATGFEDMFSSMFKMAAPMWKAAADMWSVHPEKASTTQNTSKSRLQETMESTFKTWQTGMLSMSEPVAVKTLMNTLPMLPDIMLKLAGSGMESFISFYKQWSKRFDRMQNTGKPFDFSDIDTDFLNRWTHVYETEMQKFFNLPQIGLTRLYQERASQVLDRYNLFQSAAAELIHLLGVPFEKSFQVLQTTISQEAESGKLKEDARHYYNMWIKILEGHYMTLFKSSEYAHAMHKALKTLNDYIAARREVVVDTLKFLHVPTNQDMDDLYHEIYLLKKRLRTIEKSMGEQEQD